MTVTLVLSYYPIVAAMCCSFRKYKELFIASSIAPLSGSLSSAESFLIRLDPLVMAREDGRWIFIFGHAFGDISGFREVFLIRLATLCWQEESELRAPFIS